MGLVVCKYIFLAASRCWHCPQESCMKICHVQCKRTNQRGQLSAGIYTGAEFERKYFTAQAHTRVDNKTLDTGDNKNKVHVKYQYQTRRCVDTTVLVEKTCDLNEESGIDTHHGSL
jgi:hypothetical protein